MKKIVTTEMTEKSLIITVSASADITAVCCLDLSFDLVSPQTALQIAMALVSDATVPHEKTENK